MNILVDSLAFARINGLPKPLLNENPIISDVLLLKEQQRRLYHLNRRIQPNLDVDKYSLFVPGLIFPDILLNNTLDNLIEENWVVHNTTLTGDYGSLLPKLFLVWEMLSNNEEIRTLNIENPYTNSIRIMERRYGIFKDTHPKCFRVGYSEPILLHLKLYAQDEPYITSSEEDYLNELDDYFLQHKQLPDWLEEDNKRGFVKR